MLKNIYHYAMQIFNKDQLSAWKGCDSASFRIFFKKEDDDIIINVSDRYIDDGYRITSNDGKIFMSVLNDKQACQVLDQIKEKYSPDYEYFIPKEYMVKIDKQYIIKVANKYFNKQKLTKHIHKAHKFNSYKKAKKYAKLYDHSIVYELGSEYSLKQVK